MHTSSTLAMIRSTIRVTFGVVSDDVRDRLIEVLKGALKPPYLHRASTSPSLSGPLPHSRKPATHTSRFDAKSTIHVPNYNRRYSRESESVPGQARQGSARRSAGSDTTRYFVFAEIAPGNFERLRHFGYLVEGRRLARIIVGLWRRVW
jgi:hypothetical protein